MGVTLAMMNNERVCALNFALKTNLIAFFGFIGRHEWPIDLQSLQFPNAPYLSAIHSLKVPNRKISCNTLYKINT